MDHESFLDRIMDLDENIRYATVCDMEGNQKAERKRNNVSFLLSPEETKETLQHAISAWKSRMKHYDKIGNGLYTLAAYEKLRRVTVPLKDDHILLVTIDTMGGQKDIVDRILNQLYGDYTKY
ncbi:MAG: hypothetical protein GWN01_03115 [Nitrosopumilaceae archaeon]|nr:hypothetical protein [Nitrosopumilaceae archaeon]NIT99955.1 hypothetical protein [Nitrosopumilaceae archaeon]NIU86309.1 hypothetical protein [Nitrosopumilaceae archaeon]NIV65064.1 hypothetical protein [Nitrosopumilaceae archaeon]NIX60558.1 hypothetical protein [Nitrosopumilaceae archaeon]